MSQTKISTFFCWYYFYPFSFLFVFSSGILTSECIFNLHKKSQSFQNTLLNLNAFTKNNAICTLQQRYIIVPFWWNRLYNQKKQFLFFQRSICKAATNDKAYYPYDWIIVIYEDYSICTEYKSLSYFTITCISGNLKPLKQRRRYSFTSYFSWLFGTCTRITLFFLFLSFHVTC